MTTNTIVLIVVVVLIALLLIAALAWVARNKRNQHRHTEAESIRGEARDESRHVAQREARAEETAAKARAAQAEADIRTAQAKGLQQEPPAMNARPSAHATTSTKSSIAQTPSIRPPRPRRAARPLTARSNRQPGPDEAGAFRHSGPDGASGNTPVDRRNRTAATGWSPLRRHTAAVPTVDTPREP